MHVKNPLAKTESCSVNVKELISARLGLWLGTAPSEVKLQGDLALQEPPYRSTEWIYHFVECI